MSGVWWIITAVCAAAFLLGTLAAVSLFRGRPVSAWRVLLAILSAALATRVVLGALTDGHAMDVNTFSAWAGHAADGLLSFYSPGYFADYPPGYIYVLWIVGKLRMAFGLDYGSPGFLLLLKTPAIIADLATVWILYRLARRHWSGPAAAAVAALYAFNPAVILDSAVWGQVDSVLTLFVLLGILLLERYPAASAASLALALLVKPQALIFAPVPLLWFGWRLIRRRPETFRNALVFIAAGEYVFLAGVLPFVIQHGPWWIVEKYGGTMASYPFASFNAYNLFALAGANGVETSVQLLGVPLSTWGIILLGLTVVFAAVVAFRAIGTALNAYLALFLSASVFVLSTKMHERYLFPAMVLALALYILSRDWRALAVFAGFSVTQYLNMEQVLALSKHDIYLVPPTDGLLLAVSAANVLLWGLVVSVGVGRLRRVDAPG